LNRKIFKSCNVLKKCAALHRPPSHNTPQTLTTPHVHFASMLSAFIAAATIGFASAQSTYMWNGDSFSMGYMGAVSTKRPPTFKCAFCPPFVFVMCAMSRQRPTSHPLRSPASLSLQRLASGRRAVWGGDPMHCMHDRVLCGSPPLGVSTQTPTHPRTVMLILCMCQLPKHLFKNCICEIHFCLCGAAHPLAGGQLANHSPVLHYRTHFTYVRSMLVVCRLPLRPLLSLTGWRPFQLLTPRALLPPALHPIQST
jgi:hypothetical protein